MRSGLFDNPLSRKLAVLLEQDHNRKLGVRRTMRLARRFNRLKNLRYLRFRQGLFDRHRGALLAENGASGQTGVKMTDGWVLDTSQSLPHLDGLLAAADEIIGERGGVKRGGGERSFFQQILTDEHIHRFPAILDFATSSDVLQTAIDYLGFLPALSVSKPLGVRLAESDLRLSDAHDGKYHESQLFHCDYHDSPMVYVIVALKDVTARSGPFSFLPAHVSRQAADALRYGDRGCPYRISDDEMYRAVSRDDLVELTCPAGTVLFVDSSACFHYGSRDAVIPRYLMMYAYVSVCRTDFGDLLRKESPTWVTDDSSRTRRAKYPIRRKDSRLRRLVLDREYLGGETDDTSAGNRAAASDERQESNGQAHLKRNAPYERCTL